MLENKIILGFVGPKASGKDVIADYICDKYDFNKIILSDFLIEHIKKNNLGEPNRDLLQIVGDDLRKKHGPDHLIRKALKTKGKKIIISGVRNVIEAETLIEEKGVLVSCNTPIETRYDRISSRGSAKDGINFEKFKLQEKVEENTTDKHGMNIPGVMKMAKYHIENTGTLEELYKKADDLAEKLGVK